MLLSGDHIVAAMGINDGQTDFRHVFGEMGIPEAWILTPDASAEQITKAFRRIAHALELAADSQQQFQQLTAGLPPDH
jgi:lysophospholipase L1-like esterase